MSNRADIYTSVTNEILASLTAGVKPWRKSWASSGEQLRVAGQPYKGINQLILGFKAMGKGYASPYWMTFKQALEFKGAVRKGEKATAVVLFKTFEVKDAAGDVTGKVPVLRTYSVFNASQCDGLPPRFYPAAHINQDARDLLIEERLKTHAAPVLTKGEQPCYVPSRDEVWMPDYSTFVSNGAFIATLAHELVHSTKHKTRLERDTASYALEELVAELGACFACARLRIEGEHIDNHAAYLDHWIKAMREDPKVLFRAATMAQAAVDFLLPEEDDDGQG